MAKFDTSAMIVTFLFSLFLLSHASENHDSAPSLIALPTQNPELTSIPLSTPTDADETPSSVTTVNADPMGATPDGKYITIHIDLLPIDGPLREMRGRSPHFWLLRPLQHRYHHFRFLDEMKDETEIPEHEKTAYVMKLGGRKMGRHGGGCGMMMRMKDMERKMEGKQVYGLGHEEKGIEQHEEKGIEQHEEEYHDHHHHHMLDDDEEKDGGVAKWFHDFMEQF